MKIKEEAVGGLAAGVVGTVIGYPLDLIKTRMQTAGRTAPTTEKTITRSAGHGHGIFSTGYGIIRHEGLRALYKGMAPPLVSLTILNTTTFTLYGEVRSAYGATVGFDWRNGAAGATAAPFAALISTVENLIKTQMQLDNLTAAKKSTKQLQLFNNSWHCVTSLVQNHGGVGILYTGFGINLVRETTFLYTYFYMYEGLRQTLLQNAHMNPQLAVPVAGGCSGALGWFVSFPLDCIRAGVQGQNMTMSPTTITNHNKTKTKTSSMMLVSARQVASSLYHSKGIRGLYAGVTPSIARAFLVSGSRFSAYECAIYLFTGKRYHHSSE
jgi:solute carrier family 25 carnitine/acylcarnitine transporter 20/29